MSGAGGTGGSGIPFCVSIDALFASSIFEFDFVHPENAKATINIVAKISTFFNNPPF